MLSRDPPALAPNQTQPLIDLLQRPSGADPRNTRPLPPGKKPRDTDPPCRDPPPTPVDTPLTWTCTVSSGCVDVHAERLSSGVAHSMRESVAVLMSCRLAAGHVCFVAAREEVFNALVFEPPSSGAHSPIEYQPKLWSSDINLDLGMRLSIINTMNTTLSQPNTT